MTYQPKIRELRVTDIRCQTCGAASGEGCNFWSHRTLISFTAGEMLSHVARRREHAELVAEGWQWQEVDPRDLGANNRGEE